MNATFENPGLAVRISSGPDALIAASGDLDLAGVPIFEAAVRNVVQAHARRATLDLGGLAFIDGAGLHAVLDLRATCLEAGTELTVVPGPRNVQRVFELTGTDRLLPFSRPGNSQERSGNHEQPR